MIRVTDKIPNILVLALNKGISLFLTALVIKTLITLAFPTINLTIIDIIILRFVVQLVVGKGVEFSFVTR